MEILFAMFIFLGILGSVFFLFVYGSRMFHHASVVQGVQGDARRIASVLRKDISLSDFITVTSLDRTTTLSDGTVVRRDAFSTAALSDWQDPSNFQIGVRVPKWNQFVVCYSTRGEKGRLIRQVISPTSVPSEGFIGPYQDLSANLSENPSLNRDVIKTSVLSEVVEQFQAQPDLSENTVELSFVLRRLGNKTAGTNKRIDESIEFKVLVKTKNTWPDI